MQQHSCCFLRSFNKLAFRPCVNAKAWSSDQVSRTFPYKYLGPQKLNVTGLTDPSESKIICLMTRSCDQLYSLSMPKKIISKKKKSLAGKELSFRSKLINWAEGMDYCAIPVPGSVPEQFLMKF